MKHIASYKALREAQANGGADETVTTTVSFLSALMRNSSSRDDLAAKAMQAYVSREAIGIQGNYEATIAEWSYEMADAMIAERDRTAP